MKIRYVLFARFSQVQYSTPRESSLHWFYPCDPWFNYLLARAKRRFVRSADRPVNCSSLDFVLIPHT